MIDSTASRAGAAAFQALDQDFLIDIQKKDTLKLGPGLSQAVLKELKLNQRPGEAIEQNASLAGDDGGDIIAENGVNDVIGDQLTGLHDSIHLQPQRGLLGDFLAQQVARREMNETEFLNQRFGLSSLARTRRAKQSDIERTVRHH